MSFEGPKFPIYIHILKNYIIWNLNYQFKFLNKIIIKKLYKLNFETLSNNLNF